MRLRDLRAEYRKRATVQSGFTLCHFCRSARVIEGDEGLECTHPLTARFPCWDVVFPGDDCWAFRPGRDYPLDRLDAIVAQIIAGWEAGGDWLGE
ncbi:MAG: hypothetical protein WC718_18935 [Phycisphaerales bacterium]|jgi:hypothetical protein